LDPGLLGVDGYGLFGHFYDGGSRAHRKIEIDPRNHTYLYD
jgi:hypothetical protein